MQHCQHPLPLSMAEYEALPDRDGIISDRAMDTFECRRPAGIKHHGMWLCADHYDSVCRGKRLIEERRSQRERYVQTQSNPESGDQLL